MKEKEKPMSQSKMWVLKETKRTKRVDDSAPNTRHKVCGLYREVPRGLHTSKSSTYKLIAVTLALTRNCFANNSDHP